MSTSDRITVAGIRPMEGSIRPVGDHLRWAFPARFGFPAKGFVVYRRRSGPFKSPRCLTLTKDKTPTTSVVARRSVIEGVSFNYPAAVQIRGNGTNLGVEPPSSGLLE